MTTIFGSGSYAQESSGFFQQASSGLSPMGSVQFQTPAASYRLPTSGNCVAVAGSPQGHSYVFVTSMTSVCALTTRSTSGASTPAAVAGSKKVADGSGVSLTPVSEKQVGSAPTAIAVCTVPSRQNDVYVVVGMVDGSVQSFWFQGGEGDRGSWQPLQRRPSTSDEPVTSLGVTKTTEARLQFVFLSTSTSFTLLDSETFQPRYQINLRAPVVKVLPFTTAGDGSKNPEPALLLTSVDRSTVIMTFSTTKAYLEESPFAPTQDVAVSSEPFEPLAEGTSLLSVALSQSAFRGVTVVGGGAGWWGTLQWGGPAAAAGVPPAPIFSQAVVTNHISIVAVVNEDCVLIGCGSDLLVGSTIAGINNSLKPLRVLSNFAVPINDIVVIPSDTTRPASSAVVVAGREVVVFLL